MALSEATVKNAKPKPKAYKLSDELGMFLLVNPNGSRLWRLKYRFGGKEKLLALGGYPEVSLKRAREYRDAARLLLKEDKDPATERKTAKRTARLHAENAFEQVAREFVQQQKARWSKAHAADVLHRLEIYIFPDLGGRPIAEIAALELLDVVRKLEARGATDLSHRMLQTCGPAPRMKMKREHLVPLPRQALSLLTQLRNINGDAQFVFAGSNPRKHISNNTLLYALYRLGYHSRMTGHGFRALASTILNEERERGSHSFGADVIERQLAHLERNKVRGAYNRAEYLRERVAMMQWWADFLDGEAGGAFVQCGPVG